MASSHPVVIRPHKELNEGALRAVLARGRQQGRKAARRKVADALRGGPGSQAFLAAINGVHEFLSRPVFNPANAQDPAAWAKLRDEAWSVPTEDSSDEDIAFSVAGRGLLLTTDYLISEKGKLGKAGQVGFECLRLLLSNPPFEHGHAARRDRFTWAAQCLLWLWSSGPGWTRRL
jgi:hypothetical protein